MGVALPTSAEPPRTYRVAVRAWVSNSRQAGVSSSCAGRADSMLPSLRLADRSIGTRTFEQLLGPIEDGAAVAVGSLVTVHGP